MMNLDMMPLELMFEILYNIDDFKDLIHLRETCKLYKEIVDDRLENAIGELLTQTPKDISKMCFQNEDAARFIVINFPWLLGCHSLTAFNAHAKEAEEWFGVDLSKYHKRDSKYSTGAYLREVCHTSERLHVYAITHLENYISPITFDFMKLLYKNKQEHDVEQKKSDNKCTIM